MSHTFVAVAALSMLCASFTSGAQTVSPAQRQALDIIGSFARELCTTVGASGNAGEWTASLKGKAEVKDLVTRVAELGFKGATEVKRMQYEGVLQADLATVLRADADCRYKVFEKLQEKLVTATTIDQSSNKPRLTIVVPAASFVRGDRVALASGQVARYGSDVLLNAPPYISGPNSAEFEFRVDIGGSYRFEAEYASADSRPLKAILNNVIISHAALGAPTGCFDPQCQRWMQQGEVQLRSGLNILRLETVAVFPHLRTLRFVPSQ